MSLDQDTLDIVFSYWSPSKTIKERWEYCMHLMHFLWAFEDTGNCEDFRTEEKRLLDTIVTVPWAKEAYKHHDRMGDLRLSVHMIREYVRNGFT